MQGHATIQGYTNLLGLAIAVITVALPYISAFIDVAFTIIAGMPCAVFKAGVTKWLAKLSADRCSHMPQNSL